MRAWLACAGLSFVLGGQTLTGCGASRTAALPAANTRSASLTVRIAVPPRIPIASLRRIRSTSRPPTSATFTINRVNGSVPNGGPTTTSVGLTPTSPGCSGSGPSLQCAVTIAAPIGTDGLIFTLTDADGHALSTSAFTATVVAGAANATSLTLNPVLAGLAFSPSEVNCNAAYTCSTNTVLTPRDAAGATIVGPGTFVNAAGTPTPVTLAAAGTLSLKIAGGAAAPTTLNGPRRFHARERRIQRHRQRRLDRRHGVREWAVFCSVHAIAGARPGASR